MLNLENINSIIETQLAVWPDAKSNYDALSLVKRRSVVIDGFETAIQFNPARIISTNAAVDDVSLKKRKCFLCSSNRPQNQFALEIVEGWDLLVNPFPIFPVHFTIASKKHIPQECVPADIVSIAENLPGMAIFFNGKNAGASAPDHLHLQAVLKDELPLVRLVERCHPNSVSGILRSNEIIDKFPYLFFSGVVSPSLSSFPLIAAALKIGGLSGSGAFDNTALVNSIFWISNTGILRFICVPRRAHRPACFFYEESEKILISPGCVDMSGILITPREKDFDSLSVNDIKRIFSDVAYPHDC